MVEYVFCKRCVSCFPKNNHQWFIVDQTVHNQSVYSDDCMQGWRD